MFLLYHALRSRASKTHKDKRAPQSRKLFVSLHSFFDAAQKQNAKAKKFSQRFAFPQKAIAWEKFLPG